MYARETIHSCTINQKYFSRIKISPAVVYCAVVLTCFLNDAQCRTFNQPEIMVESISSGEAAKGMDPQYMYHGPVLLCVVVTVQITE